MTVSPRCSPFVVTRPGGCGKGTLTRLGAAASVRSDVCAAPVELLPRVVRNFVRARPGDQAVGGGAAAAGVPAPWRCAGDHPLSRARREREAGHTGALVGGARQRRAALGAALRGERALP